MQARILLPVLALLVATSAAEAQVYRWVDKDGKVRYSDQKPPDAKADKLNINSAPSTPVPPAEGSGEAPAAQPAEGAEGAAPTENDAVRAQLEKLRAERCETAKAVMVRYQNAPYLERNNGDGTKTRLTPAEEAAERVKVQREMTEACAAPAGN